MKIKQKLILSYLAISLLGTIAGYLGIKTIDKVKIRFDRLAEQMIPVKNVWLAIFIGILVSISISKPMEKLKATAVAISKGECAIARIRPGVYGYRSLHRVFATGADDFVNKPIVGSELVARILNRLERTRMLRKLTGKKV